MLLSCYNGWAELDEVWKKDSEYQGTRYPVYQVTRVLAILFLINTYAMQNGIDNDIFVIIINTVLHHRASEATKRS